MIVSGLLQSGLLQSGLLQSGLVGYKATTALVGGLFNFLLSTFQTTVPTTQTRTFQETHVYTGGTKWLLKANGFLGSTTAPEEPVLYNTSGTRLGIVLEPAATNECLHSGTPSSAAWVKSNCSVTSSVTAPDGGTAEVLTTTGTAYLGAQFTPSSTGQRTVSIWLRSTGADISVNLSLWRTSPFHSYMTTAITITSTWQRFTATTPSTLLDTSGHVFSINSIATGQSFAAWGGQIETGTVATSYIPTTTASVTRTADTCYRVLGPEYAAGQGSLAVDFYRSFSIAGNTSGVGFDDGSDNNVIGLGMATTNALAWVRTGGVTQANAQQTFSTSTINRFAMSWQTNSIKGAVNNVGLTEDTSATIPTVTTLRIAGMGVGGTFALQPQTVARVRYSNTAWAQALVDSVSNGGEGTSVTLDFNYATGVYQYTPVNAGVTTNYSLSTLISSGLMTLTGSPSAKWVRGSNGLLTQVTAGELAIEYDASGNVLGCINTEPARTNAFNYSNDFANAYWTKGAITLTAAAATSPDGSTNATSIVPTAVSSASHAFNAPNMSSTSLSTQGIWAKANGYSRILIRENGVAGNSVCFDLSNGTIFVTNGANISGTIENWGNGWYRCNATMTVTGTQGFAVYVVNNSYVSGDPAGYAWTGDGTSGVLVYGAQREIGVGYPSSYIPTTSASVTRNADVWTLNLGSWFDNSKFVVATKVYGARADMREGTNGTVFVGLGPTSGTSDYLFMYQDTAANSRFQQAVGGVVGALQTTIPVTFPGVNRYAFGLSPSNAKGSVNGTTVALTGTPSPVQAAFVKAGLGNWIDGTNPDQGSVYIQSLNIFPVVPTQENVNQYAGAA